MPSIDSSGLARGASERGFEDTSSSEDGFDVEILRRAPAWNPTALARPATIDMLPDDTLLKIFGFYQMSSPLHWHRLAHICQKWRSIIFESSRKPDLRLCRSTPASRPRWLALPIFVKHEGHPTLNSFTPEDEDNIVAALKHPDRVSSIHLTATTSFLEEISLSTIEKRFSELQSTLPSTFQPNIKYPSPVAFAGVLYRMTQLRSLSLYLRSSASRHETADISSLSVDRVVLPALTHFKFRGTSEFLDRFVTLIDSPFLGDIEITFDQPTFHVSVSNLSKFIDRIEVQKPYCQADVLSSKITTSITFTQPGVPMRLKFSCGPSPRGILISRICSRFSTFLVTVEDLRVDVTGLTVPDYEDSIWLRLIRQFRGAKWLHVTGSRSTEIVYALTLLDKRKIMLPALQKLCIWWPEPHFAFFFASFLQNVVASFMQSRWLSGHFIGVEYERPWIGEMDRTAGPFSWQATIEVLSNDVLLTIFLHYLDSSPQSWPTLVHVCQNWRQIVFTSPLGLHLRVYCKHGTPVLKSLDVWPALPIVVQYGGTPTLDSPTPEDEDNIVAALKHSDRVCSINLIITNSLMEKFSAIKEPLSELEELTLLSLNNLQLTLPSTFRWGPRLHTLHSTRIAIPSLPERLLPSQGLIDLQLHEIPGVGYFPPESFANALSGMTQLRSLSLYFLSLPSRRKHLALPPTPGERIVLPSLSSLKYRGTSKYLDCLVARIDAPHLEDIDITFFSQPTLDTSQLGRFIDQIGTLRSHSRADIRFSERAISIYFTNPGVPTRLRLQISCEQPDWQWSSLAQICGCHQFSPFLIRVRDLDINTTQQPSSEQDDADSEHLGEHWLELFHSFIGVEMFCLAGRHATNILLTLQAADRETRPLPALKILLVQGPESGALRAAVGSFVTSRRLSGHPIKVEGVQPLFLPSSIGAEHEDTPGEQLALPCQDCDVRFATQRDLTRHIQDEHKPHRCAFCSFTWSPQSPYSYGTHLRQRHPEIGIAGVLSLYPRQHSFPTLHPGGHDILSDYELEHILRGFTDDPYPANPSSSPRLF